MHGYGEPEGWAQYQLERFYDAPLVADAACTRAATDDSFELSFTSWNQFKQDNPVGRLSALASPFPPPQIHPYYILSSCAPPPMCDRSIPEHSR